MFHGVECRERIDLVPTPPNIRYAINRRAEILSKIEREKFNYADEFPLSANARRFGAVSSTRLMADLFDEHEQLVAPTVEASTWLGYSKIIKNYLRPWFGHVRARDLTNVMIEQKLLAAGITLKTARNIVSVLNAPLERAMGSRELETNPLYRVKLKVIWPKEKRSSGWRPDPFSFKEMTAIFGACRNDEEADYWRAAFGTGMRTSEQIILPWSHVDLATIAGVKIEVAEVLGMDGMVKKGPKTDAGRRVIPFTAGALEAFQRQFKRTGTEGGRVFRDARYMSPWRGEQPLRKRWSVILKKAEVRYRNPYQTRHTFGSVMLAAGHSQERVAGWMGHESTEMLQRHYGRWIEQGSDPDTRAALDAFFSHPSPTVGAVVAFRR